MHGLDAFGGDGLAGGLPGAEELDAAYQEFLRDTKQRARFLVEVNAMAQGGAIASFSGVDAFGSTPLAHTQGAPAVLGERTFLFGDGAWIGRPSDILKPNKLADARIIVAADIERSIPVGPDAPRRGEVAVGEITLANGDGGLDAFAADYSISGRSIRIYLGAADANFEDFALVQEVFGSHFEADDGALRMRVQSTASFLDTPLQKTRFRGTGGQDGDPDLASRPIPLLYGECFNVSPVLINRDQWIYQLHDGPIHALLAVKERGLLLDDSGDDAPSYGALRALDVAGGEYATCKALGLVKLGLGVGGPEGPITMDVRGETVGGTYNASMGAVLLRLATSRAQLHPSYLDLNSFGDLPNGRIGFYADGGEEMSVAQAFDLILGSISGWYATSRSKLLKVGYAQPPDENDSWRYHFDQNQIFELEEVGREQPPRYEQGALYAKNWTVMAPGDISDAVATAERERLQAGGLYIRQVAAEVRLRDRSAVQGGDIVTYFTEREDAEAVVRRIISMHRQSRRRFQISTPRVSYLVDLSQKVRISYDRHQLAAGKNFLVTGVRDDSRRNRVELTLWG
jgi:hypothetical protein